MREIECVRIRDVNNLAPSAVEVIHVRVKAFSYAFTRIFLGIVVFHVRGGENLTSMTPIKIKQQSCHVPDALIFPVAIEIGRYEFKITMLFNLISAGNRLKNASYPVSWFASCLSLSRVGMIMPTRLVCGFLLIRSSFVEPTQFS